MSRPLAEPWSHLLSTDAISGNNAAPEAAEAADRPAPASRTGTPLDAGPGAGDGACPAREADRDTDSRSCCVGDQYREHASRADTMRMDLIGRLSGDWWVNEDGCHADFGMHMQGVPKRLVAIYITLILAGEAGLLQVLRGYPPTQESSSGEQNLQGLVRSAVCIAAPLSMMPPTYTNNNKVA